MLSIIRLSLYRLVRLQGRAGWGGPIAKRTVEAGTLTGLSPSHVVFRGGWVRYWCACRGGRVRRVGARQEPSAGEGDRRNITHQP